LTDNILQRHSLKSFSSPYSHGRSNLDYAIFLESTNYEGLLNKENLEIGFVGKSRVVRSKIVTKCDEIYHFLHKNGFEFTHHDIINNDKDRKSLIRKINRLNAIRGKKKIVFFYHYRMNENQNREMIFQKANEFLKYYSEEKESYMMIFTQKIIKNRDERKLNYLKIDTYIHFFELFTEQIWEGENNDIVFAKPDDDLIKEMLGCVQNIIKSE
jgi:hypothetical protein